MILGHRRGLTPRLTGRLTVGLNVTLTLTAQLQSAEKSEESQSRQRVKYGLSPVGLGTKNHCAGEDHQQFISQSVSLELHC
jgi:hypothetical protein